MQNPVYSERLLLLHVSSASECEYSNTTARLTGDIRKKTELILLYEGPKRASTNREQGHTAKSEH